MRKFACTVVLTGLLLVPASAEAFCGFYVSGAGAKLFNNATQVVLMRHGTRTILSMQNNYQGPPENFAMIVPVPVVLQKENVKTLDKRVFEHIDRLAAPRLVEYWEQDPCGGRRHSDEMVASSAPRGRAGSGAKMSKKKDLGVTIEAQFKVGEYEIVILSAKDSTGLDTWLRAEKYKIPEGAEPLLRPYVENGSKFFVAKVDAQKVKFEGNQVSLSPLRFHYDSKDFSLPIRLGMINAKDKQDLIVHILAPGKRYHLANYKNAFIPTNLDLTPAARKRFGEFYAALFDRTIEKNNGAVVTEYSWDASSCDPCPSPPLNYRELATLGADVLYAPPTTTPTASGLAQPKKAKQPGPSASRPAPPSVVGRPRFRRGGFVLTRLHARYSKGSIKDDLIFTEAKPVVGGRERRTRDGLEQGAKPAGINNFQARYAIRHAWTGPMECASPVRGRWGSKPRGVTGSSSIVPALNLAFAPRGKLKLAGMVTQSVPELGVVAKPKPTGGTAKPANGTNTKSSEKKKKGCGCQSNGAGSGGLALVALAFLLAVTKRR